MEIAEIKAQLSIGQVLDHYSLRADKNNRLCCPFHEENLYASTPSSIRHAARLWEEVL